MKNKLRKIRHHTSNHVVNISDKYFCDTNIWYNIYGIASYDNEPKRVAYENLLNSIYRKKVDIYIDSLVISEFINRYMIHTMRLYMGENNIEEKEADYKKRYRKTDDCATCLKDVSDTIMKILRNAKFVPTSVSLDINEIIDYFSKNRCDINDLLIDDLCERNDYWLITDDADFSFSSSKIVTYNNKLLI